MYSRKDILKAKGKSSNPSDRERVANILKKSEALTEAMPLQLLKDLARDGTALAIASNSTAVKRLDKKTVRGLLRNPSPHIGLAALETENINSMFSDAALNNIIVPITRRVFDAFKSEDAVKIKGVWEEYQSLLNTLERNQDLITILEMKTVKELFTIAHMTRSLDGRAFKKVARILVKKEDWESNTKFFERAYKEISAADLGSDTGPLKKKIEDRLAKRYRSVHRDNRNFKTPS